MTNAKRRTMLTYTITLVIFLVFLGAGFAFVRFTQARTADRFEQFKNNLKHLNETNQLPEEWQGVDLEKLDLSQNQMRLLEDEALMLDIAAALSDHCYFLIGVGLLACLGLAALVNWWKS
jgi:hypothetical protein